MICFFSRSLLLSIYKKILTILSKKIQQKSTNLNAIESEIALKKLLFLGGLITGKNDSFFMEPIWTTI